MRNCSEARPRCCGRYSVSRNESRHTSGTRTFVTPRRVMYIVVVLVSRPGSVAQRSGFAIRCRSRISRARYGRKVCGPGDRAATRIFDQESRTNRGARWQGNFPLSGRFRLSLASALPFVRPRLHRKQVRIRGRATTAGLAADELAGVAGRLSRQPIIRTCSAFFRLVSPPGATRRFIAVVRRGIWNVKPLPRAIHGDIPADRRANNPLCTGTPAHPVAASLLVSVLKSQA